MTLSDADAYAAFDADRAIRAGIPLTPHQRAAHDALLAALRQRAADASRPSPPACTVPRLRLVAGTDVLTEKVKSR